VNPHGSVDATPTPDTLVSSRGTARRLQALMAIGWDSTTLGLRLDVHKQQISKWRYGYQERIPYRMHCAVAALYRELESRPGSCERARIQARTHGYAPPACWDDDGDLDHHAGRPKGFIRRNFDHPTTSERTAA
jgi:hypothetical protein